LCRIVDWYGATGWGKEGRGWMTGWSMVDDLIMSWVLVLVQFGYFYHVLFGKCRAHYFLALGFMIPQCMI
jgi:hypothetical protein